MNKVFIKYNPYKLETAITIDKKKLPSNIRWLEKAAQGNRLQEWVEELPQLLLEECNDGNFEITFHGTLLDYEDVAEVLEAAKDKVTTTLTHIPAKEAEDKVALIDDVFKEILDGPFAELKSADIQAAFKQAKKDEFEICVVATMSAGKSTLINAMLGEKLMPSRTDACTATITRIKDNDQLADKPFRAQVYDKKGQLIMRTDHLTLTYMDALNPPKDDSLIDHKDCSLIDTKDISVIEVEGDIPFVSSDETSLVLIDTPGPNNAQNENHKKVQQDLLGKSSKALILYVMTGEFGTNDDNQLLADIARSMAVAGKQSKDRFIFVVNKFDARKKEDGDTESALEKVRNYLKRHGINNPNLFPLSAEVALNLRMMANHCHEVDEETKDHTELMVKKLNRNPELHLEQFAMLPHGKKNAINDHLEQVKQEWVLNGGEKNQNPAEAIIHTGIISLEQAIDQYVCKYAKTAKIKNIVDTFNKKLKDIQCIEALKQQLDENKDKKDDIKRKMDLIKNKLKNGNEAKAFSDNIDKRVDEVIKEGETAIEKLRASIQQEVDNTLMAAREKRDIPIEEIDSVCKDLTMRFKPLETQLSQALNTLIQEKLLQTNKTLFDDYRKKLSSLIADIPSPDSKSITIDPLQFIASDISSVQNNMDDLVKEKEVEAGKKWIENTDKSWYKPWTWWDEDGYYKTLFKKQKYVNASELSQSFMAPIEEAIQINVPNAQKHFENQAKKTKDVFKKEKEKLDSLIDQKLGELERFASEGKVVESELIQLKQNLNWLDKIQIDINAILDI